MNSKDFYRHIVEKNGSFRIKKGNEFYGNYKTLEDALYERDRLMAVDWDWDLSMELPESENVYCYMELPPFNHQPSHITIDCECWVVRGKGRKQKYYGRFYSEEEARQVARQHEGTVTHKKSAYRVQKRIDGKTRYFGRYPTLEQAQQRVRELEQNEWRK